MKQPALTDVAVLILFFNRPDHLARLFEAIRKARPSRLLLYQDGPRNANDVPRMEACRQIVENIDWECQVHRNYQTVNRGCDPSNYLSHQWAFSLYDKCVVFEDDDIPSETFLPFCKEMLDRYEYDDRVGMIQGFNLEERTPDAGAEADYFFSTNFSIWGWASWRRVVQQWDEHYHWLDDPAAVQRIEALTHERRLRTDFLPMSRAHRESGKAFYETIFHAHLLLHSQLAIVPRVNMITNIGVQDDSVHFAGSVRTLPSGYRRIFTMGRHNLNFPLQHPPYVVDHVAYRQRVYRIMGWRHPWIKAWRGIEELLLNLRYGQWKRITGALANRFNILTRGKTYR